jgi:hypothetical protein
MKLHYRLMTGVTLYAIILPILGPALDHHFAERLPFHEHIYRGAVVPEHAHLYQIPHEHTPDGKSIVPKEYAADVPAGLLHIAPITLVFTELVIDLVPAVVTQFGLPIARQVFGGPLDQQRLPDVPLEPPEQPPRLAPSLSA